MIGRFNTNIQQYLAEVSLNNTSYQSAISRIHQDAVRTAIESSSSILLNGRQPPIATAKEKLPKKTRAIVTQLLTGHNRIHGQYMNRIDPTVCNQCHDCGHSPHDTLTIESLWTAPTETAKHLNFTNSRIDKLHDSTHVNAYVDHFALADI